MTAAGNYVGSKYLGAMTQPNTEADAATTQPSEVTGGYRNGREAKLILYDKEAETRAQKQDLPSI